MKHILVPTDLTDESLAAVEIAQMLARQFGARIYLLHVLDIPHVNTKHSNKFEGVDVRKHDLQSAVQELRKFIYWKLNNRGNVFPLVMEGKPSTKIVKYAEDQEIDLIVMATHSRTGDSTHVMGSVAEEVIRSSNVPVLTVKVGVSGTTNREHYHNNQQSFSQKPLMNSI